MWNRAFTCEKLKVRSKPESKMFKIAVFVLALVAVAFTRTCDRGTLGPDVKAFRVSGCPDLNQNCRIVRGTAIGMEFDFVACKFEWENYLSKIWTQNSTASSASELRPEVILYLFGVRAQRELPESLKNGCNWLTGNVCPLNRGDSATYILILEFIEEYPLTPLTIEVRLFDQNNVIQFCTSIDAEIVES